MVRCALADFKVEFESPAPFKVEFGKVQVISSGGAPYEGDYEVMPKLEEQTLPTAQKLMKENLKIKEIPISVVSNTGGGNTVIIGG